MELLEEMRTEAMEADKAFVNVGLGSPPSGVTQLQDDSSKVEGLEVLSEVKDNGDPKDLDNPPYMIPIRGHNRKNHSPSLGVVTRNRKRLDCGSELRGRGFPPMNVTREKESKMDIVDGTQITLLEMCSKSTSHKLL